MLKAMIAAPFASRPSMAAPANVNVGEVADSFKSLFDLRSRLKERQREREFVDILVKLDGLSDQQLEILGFNRDSLAYDVNDMVDRYHTATDDLPAYIDQVTGPLPANRQIAAE